MVVENFPFPQKIRKLREKFPVSVEEQEEGVEFTVVIGCSPYSLLQTPSLC